jgi:hypothetical protein
MTAAEVFHSQFSGKYQCLQGSEYAGIEVEELVEKLAHHLTERESAIRIFLAAGRAILGPLREWRLAIAANVIRLVFHDALFLQPI